MTLEILDTNFIRIAVVDNYESLIWVDRYSEYGDFELYISMNKKLLDIFKENYYLYSSDSEHVMIIENLRITTDAESGSHLIVTGRSLESILLRRIVWVQTNLTGNLQNAVRTLITQSITSPSISQRRIPNFVFQASTDTAVTSKTITDLQFTGDVLYDAIKKMIDTVKLGFKITLNDNNQFVFTLYAGADRSYDQDANPYVAFLPSFENLINSEYENITANYCNITLVAGEDEGVNRKTAIVGNNSVTGLNRRELFTDARDISSQVDGGTLTPAQYTAALQNRGNEKLQEVKIEKNFNGKVEPTQMYKYGEHFYMGDIAQLENEFGIEAKVRIIEYIHSESTSEISEYPTFEVVDEE